MRTFLLTAVAALLLPMALHAGSKTLVIEDIVSQQEQIRADVVATKGRYADMPPHKRDELLGKQASLLRMLEGKQSADELTEDQRMQAFNTLEWIEAAINDEEDERMICVRERTIGSNRITRTCRTEAQWTEARERARELLLNRGACSNLGGVPCSGG